jgi:hypothetical protein
MTLMNTKATRKAKNKKKKKKGKRQKSLGNDLERAQI